MAKFNQKSQGTLTENFAGGQAYQQSKEVELISLLVTSFADDQFYRSSEDVFKQLSYLIDKCDKKFAAKAGIYARKKFGMRSITHVLASEIAKHISGEEWAKQFFKDIVYRPDDMMEILSYHKQRGQKIPNALKKGFAKAFEKFDGYSLAKYRGVDKKVKLVDVANLVHPKPVDKNKEALELLIKGQLKTQDTWESELSAVGQKAETPEEKQKLKGEAWGKLIKEKRLGYFALLRNLRNIIEQAPGHLDEALQTLKDDDIIRKSLVLPFRYLTAYDEIQRMDVGTNQARKVMMALNEAVDKSVKNVPVFEGDTLVVLDESGSMSGRPAKIGALFAAVLVKTNNCDFITFANNAGYRNINPMDSVLTITKSIDFTYGGTNFRSIFQTANRKYDRIIILSDMQGWIGYDTPMRDYNEYKAKYDANPTVFSFDLQSYGTLQMPENNIYCLAGFSEKVFDIMNLLEKDKDALKKEIDKIYF